jgi:hypothetical protein
MVVDIVVDNRQPIVVLLLLADSVQGNTFNWAKGHPASLMALLGLRLNILTKEIDIPGVSIIIFVAMYL